MPRARRPDPAPLELDITGVVLTGTLCWLGALLCLAIGDLLGGNVHGWWYGMCAYGVALGVIGLRYAARRRIAIRRTARTTAALNAPLDRGQR